MSQANSLNPAAAGLLSSQMRFPSPLVRGRLLRRYKRFLADVRIETGPSASEIVTAHCPNPGAMLGLTSAEADVWLARSDDPKRALPWTWELVHARDAHPDGALVGINAMRPNRIAEEAILAGAISELRGYPSLRREVRYGERSRVDLLLEGDSRPPCYVEVKNAHLMREHGIAEFPDSVTARGARHLQELAKVAASGARAVVLFVVQRSDAERFAVAADIDRAFADALRHARTAGVETLCYRCVLSPEQIVLDKALPVAV